MPDPLESTPADGVDKPTKPTRTKRARRVLLIGASPELGSAVQRCGAAQGRVAIVSAQSVAEASQQVKDAGRLDLALIPQASDGSGLQLATELKAKDPATAIVMLAPAPDFALAQRAMQIGAADLIIQPTDAQADDAWYASVVERVTKVLDRQWAERARTIRVRKLRRLCRKLNQARLEVTEQVDVLCNDLVTAYQELAVQVQNATQSAGYREAVGQELDLEAVLRKTLEYIIQQAGPCNAAVFLPSSADEFSLGGYVNYDCTKESADMLLQHLADVLAPAVAEKGEEIMHVTDNRTLDDLLGDDWNYLADCDLLALPVNHDGEALAVITLFRDNEQPFTEPAIDAMSSIADQMGELLGRIIRVHHRAMPAFDEPKTDDTYLPPSQWDGYDQEADPFDHDDDELPF
ncbi:MAG: GAF domain-containing protein [Planctomycetota bacterium]